VLVFLVVIYRVLGLIEADMALIIYAFVGSHRRHPDHDDAAGHAGIVLSLGAPTPTVIFERIVLGRSAAASFHLRPSRSVE